MLRGTCWALGRTAAGRGVRWAAGMSRICRRSEPVNRLDGAAPGWRPSRGGFRGDPYAPLVYALERIDPATREVSLAPLAVDEVPNQIKFQPFTPGPARGL